MNVKLNNLNQAMICCRQNGLVEPKGAKGGTLSFRDLMAGLEEKGEDQSQEIKTDQGQGNAKQIGAGAFEEGESWFQKAEEDQEEGQFIADDQLGEGIFPDGMADHSEGWLHEGWMGIPPFVAMIAEERQEGSQEEGISLADTGLKITALSDRQERGLPEEAKAANGAQYQETFFVKAEGSAVSSAVSVKATEEGLARASENTEQGKVNGAEVDRSSAVIKEDYGEKQNFSALVKELSPAGKEMISPAEEGQGAAVQGMGQEAVTNAVSFAEDPPQGSARSETCSQVSREIMQRLDAKGPVTFELQLEPEHLGKIDVKMEWRAGMLTIDILSARAETHHLLSSQAEKLIQSLGLQNVHVEMIQTGNSSSGEQSAAQQHSFMENGMDFSQQQQQRSSDELKDANAGQAYTAQVPAEEEPSDQGRTRVSSFQRMNLAV